MLTGNFTTMKTKRFVLALGLTVIPLLLTLPAITSADSPPPAIVSPIACDNARCLFLQFIKFFLGGVGFVSTAMFIWGGFLFLTAGGNVEQIKKGKEVLLWSSLGIAVILASWAILQYFIKGLLGSTGSG